MTTTPFAPENTPKSFLLPLEGVEFDVLNQEKYRLGEIVDIQQIHPAEFGMAPHEAPAAIYEVAVSDPYIEAHTPQEQAEVLQQEYGASEFARVRREAGMWSRKAEAAYVDLDNNEQPKTAWGDPESTKLFFDEMLDSNALRVWRRDLVPSALALAYLSDPQQVQTVTSKEGEVVEVDDTARKWWALCTDGVAIRSRATVMAELVKEHVTRQQATGEDQDFRWMSIACGTALPTMKAAVHSGVQPKITLIDFDRKAMSATKELAAEIGFEGDIDDQKPMNIFNTKNLDALRDKLAAEGKLPSLVDMMGIFEYIGDDTGVNVDASDFLRAGYDLVAPGGRLVLGQMRDDRLVEDFTMGVVAWPTIEQRSPKELMQVITAAGIPRESVRMFMPTDGVYTVVSIQKPEALEMAA